MNLDEYIASLSELTDATTHIELDKEKEIVYMLEEKFHFERVLESIPRSATSIRILDIGTTPFTIFVKLTYPLYDVWTLDRTELLKERCKVHGIHLRACDLDDHPPPFDDEYFDLVIFTEVLEHIFAPPREVLTGIRQILRAGGKLILSVPNIAALNKRIKLLVGVTPLPHPDLKMRKDWVHGHGHLHEYTMKEIVSVLKACGFKIAKKGFLHPKVTDGLRWPGRSLNARLLRAAYHAAQGLWPAFGTQIFVECHK